MNEINLREKLLNHLYGILETTEYLRTSWQVPYKKQELKLWFDHYGIGYDSSDFDELEVPEYDSTRDTQEHIGKVQRYMITASMEILKRAEIHDKSKLESPEKEIFDEFTPKLKNCTYGSDEYTEFLKSMRVALDHHYANNSHHPEFFGELGINGMDLFDVLEMLMDWKAASERHRDGDISQSLEVNTKRFDISPQLRQIMENTVRNLGWKNVEDE